MTVLESGDTDAFGDERDSETGHLLDGTLSDLLLSSDDTDGFLKNLVMLVKCRFSLRDPGASQCQA